jgi:hypothetical protein
MKKILLTMILTVFSLFADDFQLGYEYLQKGDNFKAAELNTKACDGGAAGSCGMLGLAYQYGKGVKQDYSKAKELFGKDCDLGEQLGCDSYAKLNQQGY